MVALIAGWTLAELEALCPGGVLKKGEHDAYQDGVSVLELVDLLDRKRRGVEVDGTTQLDADCGTRLLEPRVWSCRIAEMVSGWSSAFEDDDTRTQIFSPLVGHLLDSAGPLEDGWTEKEREDRRGWMMLDWAIRHHAGSWLSAAGIAEGAELRSAGEITDDDDLFERLGPVIDQARYAAYASAAHHSAHTRNLVELSFDAQRMSGLDARVGAIGSDDRTVEATTYAVALIVNAAQKRFWPRRLEIDGVYPDQRAAIALAPTISHLIRSATQLVRRLSAVGTKKSRAAERGGDRAARPESEE